MATFQLYNIHLDGSQSSVKYGLQRIDFNFIMTAGFAVAANAITGIVGRSLLYFVNIDTFIPESLPADVY